MCIRDRSQYLPAYDIKLNNDITLETILNTDDNDDIGYIVEGDLTFPKHLHDKFKDVPPCPENITPKKEWLSQFQTDLIEEQQHNTKCKKLVPHLYEHKNYCLHYRTLKFVKSLGVEIGTVHNVVSFTQEPWMKPYIDFNTDKRKDAKNEFEKVFFKLMNNAVFGKTMENVKNRANIHATTSDENAIKWLSLIHI